MVTGLELVKSGSPRSPHELFYWENLDKGTTSEVDYLISRNMKIVPIEVKSGTSGRMKSLRLFMKNRGITEAIRLSLENFGRLVIDDDGTTRTIDIVPLYAIPNLRK